LQTGTLDLLVGLSEELPKYDLFFTSAMAKIVDTLRNLLNNDTTRLAQHTLVDERSVDDYLLRGWSWNSSKYGTQRGLRDIVDSLVKVRSLSENFPSALNALLTIHSIQEMTSIDTVLKSRLNSYNLAKGSLTQLQRKSAYVHQCI
jgi:V-type H+-transporting ATPase subunit C